MIDLTIITEEKGRINLTEQFGPSLKPAGFPYHVVQRKNELFALEVVTLDTLLHSKNQPESVVHARQESLILHDRNGSIKEWMEQAFPLSAEDIRSRAMMYYSWIRYLVGEYRIDKWAYREAWIQLAHNYNAVCEYFCNFLYCINGRYIPRNDWLVYLSYELPEKPEGYEELLLSMHRSFVTEEEITVRKKYINKAVEWMEHYCGNKGWIKPE